MVQGPVDRVELICALGVWVSSFNGLWPFQVSGFKFQVSGLLAIIYLFHLCYSLYLIYSKVLTRYICFFSAVLATFGSSPFQGSQPTAHGTRSSGPRRADLCVDVIKLNVSSLGQC